MTILWTCIILRKCTQNSTLNLRNLLDLHMDQVFIQGFSRFKGQIPHLLMIIG